MSVSFLSKNLDFFLIAVHNFYGTSFSKFKSDIKT